jgi:hypothetical protein
MIDNA